MKIWYFNEKLPYLDQQNFDVQYPCGGSEIVADRLAVEMAKRGNEIHFFTTGINKRKQSVFKNGIKITRYPRSLEIMGRSFNPPLLFKAGNEKPDIIHSHVCTEMFFAFSSWYWAKRKQCPLVLTCHVNAGSYPAHIPLRNKIALIIHKQFTDFLFSMADVIISPSEGFALENKTLCKHLDKLVCIPNGINLEEIDFSISKETCRKELGLRLDRKIILFLGNPHPNKGIEVLLRAMSKVSTEIPESKLVIVGKGTEEDRLKTLTAELGLGEVVEFAGFASGVRKSMFYRSADVFALPSFYDIFPLTILEASAFGLPLVVSDIGAFEGIVVDGHNGLITKAGNTEDLAQKLISILGDNKLRSRIGVNAAKEAKNYSWTKIAERTEQLYKNMIGTEPESTVGDNTGG
ncbi:glycosyltransferase family 4 protein [Chloroflexota bacterium]